MSDVQVSEPEPEGTPKQADDRVWSDFTFEVVTDPEEERQRVAMFEQYLNDIIAEGE